MTESPIIERVRLPDGATPWPTRDPFLFCVHHLDRYPRANERFGPAASLAGRQIGQDFAGLDGWRMYHGREVPGFPSHPHRGFETVTVVRQGFIDHADSMGAAARYGAGDVQWLTAGRGIQHAEMFPLLQREDENPAELFQIWLNLPSSSKMTEPHFSMFWAEDVPTVTRTDDTGLRTEVRLIAGALEGSRPPVPPPESWATPQDHDVAIWTLKMQAGARFDLPPAQPSSHRSLYFFAGDAIAIHGELVDVGHEIRLRPDRPTTLRAGSRPAELLMLQGEPIGEPVAHHGPFVMNTRQELLTAIRDYQSTHFGGWPWDRTDPVHGGSARRFARYPDGREDTPRQNG